MIKSTDLYRSSLSSMLVVALSVILPAYADGTVKSSIVRADLIGPRPIKERIGAGAIVDSNGTVLTTFGLVASCSEIAVAWNGQSGRVAMVAAADRRANLALLTVPGVRTARYVRFSTPTLGLKPVVVTQHQDNPALTHFSAMEIADPLDPIPSTAVFWVQGPNLFPSIVGAPVLEPTRGNVRGLVVTVYPRATSAARFHLDEPVLAAVGNPIIDLFLRHAAALGHTLQGTAPVQLSAVDVESATAVVVCAPHE